MDNSQNPINQSEADCVEQEPIWSANQRLFKAMTAEQKQDFIFTYQQPREDQIPKFVAVRDALLNAANVVEANCPPCADRSHTLRLLRDARMWADAAIALDGVV